MAHLTRLTCPRCGKPTIVGHMSWSGLECEHCGAMIDKRDWLVQISAKSQKRAQTRKGARQVAMDAMLEGRVDDGEKVLKSRKTRLTKPQAKMIAAELVQRTDYAGALRVLMGAMNAGSAERAFAMLERPNKHRRRVQ